MHTVNTNNTGVLQANWLEPKVKVNYLEFGPLNGVSGLGENAFNTEAFKTVKQLVFTKFDRKMLHNGTFNGLESLEVLRIKGAYEIGEIDVEILNGLSDTLKEFTLERNGSYQWLNGPKRQAYEDDDSVNALLIDAFTGSQQTLNLEYVKVRYYLQRLRRESFLGLTKIKNLDLSNCGIEYIAEGAFDPVIGSVNVIKLTNNPFTKLPAGMLDLIPLRYDTYIFMGSDTYRCECVNIPVNYILKVPSCDPNVVANDDELCNSYLPEKSKMTKTRLHQ